MRLKVKLIGDGTSNSPYTVPLPTWDYVDSDIGAGFFIVDVPAHAHPFKPEELDSMPITQHEKHGKIHEPSKDHLKTLHEWYDTTYREHKGKFRVELV